ncbi:GyrI-like domain-containing protein [Atopococcus tabaci]|uniref:GyrI-like domain-containing protein n=1 Tax=Atopococcus tabaci TaxID=269774 RepID=UPI0024090F44|nr:GyrI-like domain-containing protein [Atopococcus tabaci]
MEPRMIEREAFRIIGVKKSFHFDDEFGQAKEIHRFWRALDEDGTLDHLIGLSNGQITGLIGATLSANEKNNQMEYMIAVEFKGNTPEDFILEDVPTAKWAVFEVIGVVKDVVPETWEKIYSHWLPTSGYELGDAPLLEVYKTRDPYSPKAKIDIWVPVK